jgi:hypothetical protein
MWKGTPVQGGRFVLGTLSAPRKVSAGQFYPKSQFVEIKQDLSLLKAGPKWEEIPGVPRHETILSEHEGKGGYFGGF